MSNIYPFPIIDAATSAIVRAQVDYERDLNYLMAITGASQEQVEAALERVMERVYALSRRQALRWMYDQAASGVPLDCIEPP